jgi:hypothetical protein
VKEKRAQALAFIQRIREMAPGELDALIAREVGEDLAQFFVTYAKALTAKDPAKLAESTSSLMLMGYLIRVAEELTPAEPPPPAPLARS